MSTTRQHRFAALVATVAMTAASACGSSGGSASRSVTETPAISAPATTEATGGETAPKETVVASDLLVLQPDGLGLVSFGDDADTVISEVSVLLGDPTDDTGWVDPLSEGTCAGETFRRVTWGALSVYFGDASVDVATTSPSTSDGDRDGSGLFAYSYGTVSELDAPPQGLSTEESIGLGTTVEFLRAAYPEVDVQPGEDGLFSPTFNVDGGPSGQLTGGDDDDLVTVIVGGDPCGVGI